MRRCRNIVVKTHFILHCSCALPPSEYSLFAYTAFISQLSESIDCIIPSQTNFVVTALRQLVTLIHSILILLFAVANYVNQLKLKRKGITNWINLLSAAVVFTLQVFSKV